jgi:hypothetical protein
MSRAVELRGATRLMRLVIVIVALSLLVAMGRVPAAAQPLTPSAGPQETDILKWSFTQGALTLVLVLTLVSYRRDFFRRIDSKQSEIDLLREEKRMLRDVIERNAEAMLSQAVAIAGNTKATELLAQNVNNLAERRGGHRT